MQEQFHKWVVRLADECNMTLEEVRIRSGISNLRFNALMRGAPASKEEIDEVATKAFGLAPEESPTNLDAALASSFLAFLRRQDPPEDWWFTRLWPEVKKREVQHQFRNGSNGDAEVTRIFRDVLSEAQNEALWDKDDPIPWY